jgi:hypothetical protein
MTTFTAKWVYEEAGIKHERLIEADEVHVAYDERKPDEKGVSGKLGIYTVPSNGGVVVLGNCYEGGDSMALVFGTVYIMNREGKTVAKYYLAKAPPWGEQSGATRPELVHEQSPKAA